MYIYKKRRCYTVNSHNNSSKPNDSNTSKNDNFIGNSNLPRINFQTKIPFNTLTTLQKETDTESSISINDEIMDVNNISEKISSHHNSEDLIDHVCDENGNNLINTATEEDITSIHSINATNNISIIDDDNFIQKYYAPFLS